jgi:hypothetical protein
MLSAYTRQTSHRVVISAEVSQNSINLMGANIWSLDSGHFIVI